MRTRALYPTGLNGWCPEHFMEEEAMPRMVVDREWLERLRALKPEGERALLGYPAIAQWFDEMAWHTREGRGPHPTTLKRWRSRYGLPVEVVLFGRAWTTNYLLMAWCVSQSAQALSPRRPDGTLRRPVNFRRLRVDSAGRPT